MIAFLLPDCLCFLSLQWSEKPESEIQFMLWQHLCRPQGRPGCCPGWVRFAFGLTAGDLLWWPCLWCVDCDSLGQWLGGKAVACSPWWGRNIPLSSHWSCLSFLDVDTVLCCRCSWLCRFSVKQIRELTNQKHNWESAWWWRVFPTDHAAVSLNLLL